MVRGLNTSRHTRQAEVEPGTIYAVTSDYGTECDDQKAWSQLVAHPEPEDIVFVMAGGPQPRPGNFLGLNVTATFVMYFDQSLDGKRSLEPHDPVVGSCYGRLLPLGPAWCAPSGLDFTS